MQISKDKIVEIHYKLTNNAGEVLEDSNEDGAMSYLHGHNNLITSLEQALEGKQAGDQVNVTFSPEQAYGVRKEDAIQRVSISHVVNPGKSKMKFKPGMIVHLNTTKGAVPATIVKVGLKVLDVDSNHPYAGMTVTFDVRITKVRDASAEEVEHGHAHGEGGHQH